MKEELTPTIIGRTEIEYALNLLKKAEQELEESLKEFNFDSNFFSGQALSVKQVIKALNTLNSKLRFHSLSSVYGELVELAIREEDLWPISEYTPPKKGGTK